jgi:hypothetical protein
MHTYACTTKKAVRLLLLAVKKKSTKNDKKTAELASEASFAQATRVLLRPPGSLQKKTNASFSVEFSVLVLGYSLWGVSQQAASSEGSSKMHFGGGEFVSISFYPKK